MKITLDLPLTDLEVQRFFSHVKIDSAHWLWNGSTTGNGYGKLTLRQRNFLAHRVAYVIVHGKWPKRNVLHSCDIKLCVNPDCIEEGSQSKNIRDAYARGRMRYIPHVIQPEGRLSSKLDWSRVKQIRSEYEAQTFKQLKPLALKFGVTTSTICLVVHEKTWREPCASL